jgi:hypothetical protein
MAQTAADRAAGVEELQTDKANYRAKLTMATIEASPERAKTEKKRVQVAEFYGIASGIKLVDNPMGDVPFTALTGNFEAVNLHNGEIWRSGVLYLPGGFHEMIVAMLNDLTDNEERSKFDKAQVQFALAIDAVPADNPAGYSYVATNLLPIAKADALSAIRTQMVLTKQERLALAAPAAAAE